MEELQLTILTKEDLKSRYDKPELKNTRMAQLTNDAIEAGCLIGELHYPGLRSDSVDNWLRYAAIKLAKRFRGLGYKIGAFTDLSEVQNDKLYFAIEIRHCIVYEHLAGCDSDGFRYNCTWIHMKQAWI